MIASLLVDEFRAQLDEEFLRAQVKTPPPSAEQRLEQALMLVTRPERGRSRVNAMRAQRVLVEAEAYDKQFVDGAQKE